MKLTMKNIGVIRDAEIELDGITVLAGLNGSGKSTVSKALYGVMASYVNLSEKVTNERKRSIQSIISTFLNQAHTEQSGGDTIFLPFLPLDIMFSNINQVSHELGTNLRPIPEQYEEWVRLFPKYLKNSDTTVKSQLFPKFLENLRKAVNRPNAEYVQFLTEQSMKSVFDRQINTIGLSKSGDISLTARQNMRLAWMKITGSQIKACSENEINANQPIYFDTRHLLDGLNHSDTEAPYIDELYALLDELDSNSTFEEYKSRERIQELIASVIHGKLTTSSFGEFMFKDDHFNEPISLRNVASGNKTFAVLQRLIENGALCANTVLIIDEPESNQHPEWQLKLAEILALLHEELGVRIFLTTHSTYFLRAIEVYSEQYEVSNHCHYYQTQPVDGAENLFYIRNVDGNTKLIYHDFYMPLEEL